MLLTAVCVATVHGQQTPRRLPPNVKAGQEIRPAAPGSLAALVPQKRLQLPGTRSNLFTTIQGNALSSTNAAVVNTLVRLRDARYGRIVDTQLTDTSGLFTFRIVDPGSYIVEMLAADRQTVLAASPLIAVNSGEVASAVVKLPFRIPPFVGVVGNSTPTAAAITTEAAAQGVMSAIIPPTFSPASAGQ
jgi:hypothetical protein